MADITMPRLSDTMSEGAVGRWLKKPGDKVQRDEVIAEIETDKATMDLVSFEDGTLQQILVPEGKTVPIGEVIGIIGEGPGAAAGASASAQPAPAQSAQGQTAAKQPAAQTAAGKAKAAEATNGKTQPAPAADGRGQATAAAAGTGASAASASGVGAVPAPASGAGAGVAAVAAGAQAAGAQAAGSGERLKASPLARRIAEEHGLDLRNVPGTGPGGRILKANVEEFRRRGGPAIGAAQGAGAAVAAGGAAQPAQAGGAAQQAKPGPTLVKGEVTPLSRVRRAVARAMSESKPGVPHIYLTVEIDVAAAMAVRKQINESGVVEAPISPNDLIVKAAARALQKHPLLNASYAQTPDGHSGMIVHPQINVSVAVATDNGLLAPVVKDADKKSLGAIAAEIRDLAARARDGSIKQPDLEGATFQTSNLGMFGVVEFVSIVTSPLAASLAIGAIRQVPVVKDGAVTVGERLNVTLSVDHRVADGAAAAQYLQDFTRLLQAPISLLV